MIADLRKALDPKPKTFGDIPDFNLKLAYHLYRQLFDPFNVDWNAIEDLIIIASGPFGQLPFSILPTKQVTLNQNSFELFSNYRQIPWLIRKVSITRQPSIAAFAMLRELPQGDPHRKAFLGFGDPVFNKKQLAMASMPVKRGKTNLSIRQERLQVRGIRISEKGNLDNNKIRTIQLEDLKRLPETSDEIKSIATVFSADPDQDVFLGVRASENRIKGMDLTDRRIIVFASHALIPGDLDGLIQPAIALCSPSVTGEDEDGLLTMGEVLKLKLNADWVVLSSCNSGGSDGRGAEALSGLGQAFFYAGAKALLATMWPVESTSAQRLTTGLFQYQKDDIKLTRAQALRKSMLDMIDSSGLKDNATGKIVASYAHPLFWAPFILVGDSGTDIN
jgi:CHAT domain-containing protein